MPKKSSKTIARTFGKFFAHLQAALDDLSEWGFSHLKKAGHASKEEELADTLSKKLKKGAKRIAHFFGEMGESFYREYQDIKARKKKDIDK